MFDFRHNFLTEINTATENIVSIEILKRQMSIKYFQLMAVLLIFYSIVFYAGGLTNLICSTLFGSVFFACLLYLISKVAFKEGLIYIRIYLIVAPLYNLYFFIILFSISVGSIVWFLPMSLGAFILYSKKEAFLYALYSIFLIFIGILIASIYGDHFYKVQSKFRSLVYFTEISAFVFNALILLIFIRYKDKINLIKNKNNKSIINDKKEIVDKMMLGEILKENETEYLSFFNTLDQKIQTTKSFTDANINISKICVQFSTNATYISRAIRAKGYKNFNHYINTLRVDYIKLLLKEEDLSKVTLLYVFTEAGFSNQPTFNRVFKQIEGITPSEYINKLHLA